ncbi:hypothetical protein WMF38_57620 [Sorangium sp. So ce118]
MSERTVAEPGSIEESLQNAKRWPEISMEELGRFLRHRTGNKFYSSQNCLRILQRHGAVREEKRIGATKGRYYTSLNDIREAFATQWDDYQKDLAGAEEDEGAF